MTEPHDRPDLDRPDLDGVLDPEEGARPDHREHAKASPHVDDDALARRTEHERRQVEHDREE